MENKYESDGLAEDMIRSFIQIAILETHKKALLEKCVSGIDNGMVDEVDIGRHLEIIKKLEVEIQDLADLLMTALNKNQYFTKIISGFLAFEVPESVTCFIDILRMRQKEEIG